VTVTVLYLARDVHHCQGAPETADNNSDLNLRKAKENSTVLYRTVLYCPVEYSILYLARDVHPCQVIPWVGFGVPGGLGLCHDLAGRLLAVERVENVAQGAAEQPTEKERSNDDKRRRPLRSLVISGMALCSLRKPFTLLCCLTD